ncbi:hypothetical protein BT63DRAFT_484400 [Microthyrium microscopicum]|uniref:Uncharacterized protein n=1 Tax=Microthyrium microscopicum TaxID=703497 RepID=A0A6A6TU92_9PEZI|nr:hypothetical protein BT63DRAFT_484400 [Microthyrium microscopicum]
MFPDSFYESFNAASGPWSELYGRPHMRSFPEPSNNQMWDILVKRFWSQSPVTIAGAGVLAVASILLFLLGFTVVAILIKFRYHGHPALMAMDRQKAKIKQLLKSVNQRQKTIDEHEETIKKHDKMIKEHEIITDKLREERNALKKHYETELDHFNKFADEWTNKHNEREEHRRRDQNMIEEHRKTIEEHENTINKLRKERDALEEDKKAIEERQNTINEHRSIIDELRTERKQLEDIKEAHYVKELGLFLSKVEKEQAIGREIEAANLAEKAHERIATFERMWTDRLRYLEIKFAQKIQDLQAQVDENKAQIDEKEAQFDEDEAQIDEDEAQIDEDEAQIDEDEASVTTSSSETEWVLTAASMVGDAVEGRTSNVEDE